MPGKYREINVKFMGNGLNHLSSEYFPDIAVIFIGNLLPLKPAVILHKILFF